MSKYAAGVTGSPYAWFDTPSDFGVLIDGRLASVPDSTSTLSLFMGVALLGFIAQRLWT